MKQIELTQGKYALVDDEDFEWLNQWKWCCNSNGYAVRNSPMIDGKSSTIYMHRLIMNTPDGMDVDHISGDQLDNRRENLRNCAHAENLRNAKLYKGSTTGYKGVSPSGRGFRAQVRVDSKRLYLGTWDTPEEAARVYDEAAMKYFGEFAKLNFGTR